MILVGTLIVSSLFSLVENRIYLYQTDDDFGLEHYDCLIIENLSFCRRPYEPVDLHRDKNMIACINNGGVLHQFQNLQANGIDVNEILHQWRSGVEQVERYAHYLRQSSMGTNEYLCQCTDESTFGKHCEYRLVKGKTLSETWYWHHHIKTIYQSEENIYGDILCYETLSCNSGLLCLDWREICDGVQQCMDNIDENNCDFLEMNICTDDEYRCMNGMCIPELFFLDGEFDCLDKSDEMPFKTTDHCIHELAHPDCDDHLCPPHQWSCGDGQCIADRFVFQRDPWTHGCASYRDRYYICETYPRFALWTLPNGRCYGQMKSLSSNILNRTELKTCELLLRCSLSDGSHIDCTCSNVTTCIIELNRTCSTPLIPYPRQPLVTPFFTFLYDRSREAGNKLPSMIRIDGTIQCYGRLTYFNQTILFLKNMTIREVIHALCTHQKMNNNLSKCSHTNQSKTICQESNFCLSKTRLNDGFENCIDGNDEYNRNETEVKQSCDRVYRHRLRCSIDQPTCLSVMAFDRLEQICTNISDQLLTLKSQEIRQLKCNEKEKSDCHRFRQLIEQSWIDMKDLDLTNKRRIPFRFYCDTFMDLDLATDENREECLQWWICDQNQISCETKKCIPKSTWIFDTEWDCDDGSDLANIFSITMDSIKDQANQAHLYVNQTYFLPQTCHSSSFFSCFAAHLPHQPLICLNQSQLGNGHIDCAGAIDEANTIPHCSHQSMLGNHYLCSSTNTCIPFIFHCEQNYRCPNRSDDERWCTQKEKRENCTDKDDFTCFNGQCVLGSRCGTSSECLLGEDEYMCDFQYALTQQIGIFRKSKRIKRESMPKTFRMLQFPFNATVTKSQLPISQPSSQVSMNSRPLSKSSELLVVFHCNRGLGIWTDNNSIVACFCSPHYYGNKCQYHADRLMVLLYLQLSESMYSTEKDPTILLKFFVFLLFNNRTLAKDEFEVRPAFEIMAPKKRMIYFTYPHRNISLLQRRKRFLNRTDLYTSQPYSIRIEAFETKSLKTPSMIAVWQYAVDFDYLPVYRFVRILHWYRTHSITNPCSSNPCHANARCQPLMNEPTRYLCMCKTNFTGTNCTYEDKTCINGYCASGSLCQSDITSMDTKKSSPYCICTANQFGQRCNFQYESCSSQPCLHGGSCFPSSQFNEVFCWCHNEYYGHRCQWKKASIRLSIDQNASYEGAVLQFFDYHPKSLDLILIHQRVHSSLPVLIEYHREKETIPSIILMKLYSFYDDNTPLFYVLSLNDNISLLEGRTEISEKNQCLRIQSLSPIQYHRICRNRTSLLCFYDDIYLCICVDDYTRVECFLYDHQSDQCDYCLAAGRCLQGDHTKSKDFLCLCPPCHSGEQCQFNSKSFTFTLDQLLYTDLVATSSQRTTISLLLFFSISSFLLAIPNNLFSFVTFSQKSCLRSGIGYYLLTLSIINQINLGLFLARIVHIIVNITTTNSASMVDEVLCKLLNYLHLSSTRLVVWLSTLVAIERLYITLFINGRWLKQPHIARRLILFVCIGVLLTNVYELFFYKSLFIARSNYRWICLFDFPIETESFWMIYHVGTSSFHSLVPLLINLCATIIISIVVVKKKMNTLRRKRSVRFIFNVLRENKELVIGPGITLIPQLFSLPLIIFSFSLYCQNIENSWLRYLFIASYWTSLTPQLISFFLYISPSSFYLSEWHKTKMAQSMKSVRFCHPTQTQMTFAVLSASRSMNKTTA